MYGFEEPLDHHGRPGGDGISETGDSVAPHALLVDRRKAKRTAKPTAVRFAALVMRRVAKGVSAAAAVEETPCVLENSCGK